MVTVKTVRTHHFGAEYCSMLRYIKVESNIIAIELFFLNGLH